MIVNAANLLGMFTGYRTSFNTGFRNAEIYWSQIATLVPSSVLEEKYGWLGQFPRLRKWIGDRVIQNLEAHDYAIKNEEFESTVAVKKREIETDQYGIYAPIMEELGHASATHPDELCFGLLEKGFETLCYDGQNFFDTDHPVGGQSVSNMQDGPGNPWFLLDTKRALKPLIFQRRKDYNLVTVEAETSTPVFMRNEYLYGVDCDVNVGFGFWQLAAASKAELNEDNFNDLFSGMFAIRSDEDRPLGVRPRVLVYGPSNRAKADQVVKAEKKANGADNMNHKVVDCLEVPWLR